MFIFKHLKPGDDLADAAEIRYTVFVDEQGFSRENEMDDTDPLAWHVVLCDGETPIATGRLFPDNTCPDKFHIGRVAALKSCRGLGLGKQLMEELESYALSLGATNITLGAQLRAKGFYEKCGYQSFGNIYLDEHCEHINMEKKL